MKELQPPEINTERRQELLQRFELQTKALFQNLVECNALTPQPLLKLAISVLNPRSILMRLSVYDSWCGC